MRNTMSKVYIIILNYNGWADTIECLESVLSNACFNYQVLIALNSKKFKSIELPDFVKQLDYHLVQSFYALNFLQNKGVELQKIYYLSDYLNKNFLGTQTDLSKKENIAAYNPKKGVMSHRVCKNA